MYLSRCRYLINDTLDQCAKEGRHIGDCSRFAYEWSEIPTDCLNGLEKMKEKNQEMKVEERVLLSKLSQMVCWIDAMSDYAGDDSGVHGTPEQRLKAMSDSIEKALKEETDPIWDLVWEQSIAIKQESTEDKKHILKLEAALQAQSLVRHDGHAKLWDSPSWDLCMRMPCASDRSLINQKGSIKSNKEEEVIR